MALEAIHSNLEDIPEQYRDLYSERNGQYELTGINGVKTQADIERMQVGLQKERDEHKATKQKLEPWRNLGEFEEVQTKLDRIPELEAAADGKVDEDKLNDLVEARIKTRLAPVERENTTLKQQIEERDASISEYKTKENKRKIEDAIRPVLVEAKVLDSAQEDALMLAERLFEVREDDGEVVMRDQVGYTPGITPKDWLSEIQKTRQHWWPPSQGGGAGGGGGGNLGVNGGRNPWSKDHWNVTEQGQVVREHGSEKAQALAKQAGSSIGSIAPPAK